MKKVAIIGAGPGGLVVARYLKQAGFEPVVFEQGNGIGGQWKADADYSGVWSSMCTNTSRVMTCFSDLSHEHGTVIYPSNQQMLVYLQRYAEQFGLMPHIRLNTIVELIDRAPENNAYVVRSLDKHGKPCTETYSNVIVATGRYNKSMIPDVPGMDSFSGADDITHTFDYKQPERYRGQRVLVAGCSISALEIASDLAMLGAASVITTNRRQRYILHKILAGVPTEHLAFTRFNALAEECMPMEVIAQGLKNFILRTSGNPEQFGALKPVDNVFEAGITQSQNYLPLVAEGRIITKPWIDKIDGQSVYFTDDSSEEVDAIIFGTGFDLNLPFLSDDIRSTLDIDNHHIDLHAFTFHPDLPGLSFFGIFELVGPYLPVLESQARWITYTLNGDITAPSREEMETGIADYRARRGSPQQFPMHALAILFSRLAGVEPVLQEWPDLTRALIFGPLAPMSFRMNGPDSLPEAGERFAEDAATFGAVPSAELTDEQCMQLKALAEARKDKLFTTFVNQQTGS